MDTEQRTHLENAIALKEIVPQTVPPTPPRAPYAWELLQAALTLPNPDTVTPPGPRRKSIEFWLRMPGLTQSQLNAIYEIM